jgi:hypothetical protein
MTAVLPSSAGSSRSRRWRTSISASRCSSWRDQSDRMEVRSIVAMPGSTALLYLQRHRTRSELASSYSRTPTVAHVIRFDVLGGPLQVFWRTTTAPLSLEPEADPLDIDTAPFEALMLPMPLANNNEPLAIDTSPSPCLCHRRLAHDQPPNDPVSALDTPLAGHSIATPPPVPLSTVALSLTPFQVHQTRKIAPPG